MPNRITVEFLIKFLKKFFLYKLYGIYLAEGPQEASPWSPGLCTWASFYFARVLMPKNIEQFGAEQKKKNSEVLKFSIYNMWVGLGT